VEREGRVASLLELTDRSAVERALEEFVELGPDRFRARYGMEPSRDYFVPFHGVLCDSKPILAVAYRNQHPERGLLSVREFSGGTGGAVQALQRLGFEAVTRAQLRPSVLGKEYANRTEIYEAYGGDKVAGIIRFPGEDIVNVFSDADGPYADDPPTLTEPFGYRGEGLNGPQQLRAGGNARLEQARISRSPVRFWYRPAGGRFSFLAWVVVPGRAWVAGVGLDGQPRPELEWRLEAVPGPAADQWPSEVVQALEDAAAASAADDAAAAPEAQAAPSYAALLVRIDQRGQPRRPNGVVRTDYPRSAAARRAVLIRSGGKCESPRCTGMPAETGRRCQPILDVDHIQDLAKGGEDHPRNMVALCPNCHACKTRGRNPARWRQELTQAARHAHHRALAAEAASSSP
jgi:5-methylcytosine-specific restriction enzyme A